MTRYIGYLTNATFDEGVEKNLSEEEDDAKGKKTGKQKNEKRTSRKEESGNSTEPEKLPEHNEKAKEEEESRSSNKAEDFSEPSPLAAHYFRQVAASFKFKF